MPSKGDWGRFMWPTLHYVAMGYPERPGPEDRAAYKAFFEGLGRVLPCAKCRPSFRKHLDDVPIDAYLDGGPRRLFEWTVVQHNKVNMELGKPVWDADAAWERYSGGPSPAPRLRWASPALAAAVAFALAWWWLTRR